MKLEKPNSVNLQRQNLLLHGILQLYPAPPNPKAVFSVENHVVDVWSCRGINRALMVSVAAAVVLSERACGKTQSCGWLFVTLVLMRKHQAVSGSQVCATILTL